MLTYDPKKRITAADALGKYVAESKRVLFHFNINEETYNLPSFRYFCFQH